MDSATLNRLASNPAEFRAELVIPAADGPRPLRDCIADFQRRDFEAIDPALLAIRAGTKPPIGRYWLERTKGGSKDTDLAVSLLWLLAFAPRPLACQVGAADADQADELRKAAKAILRLNPWLGKLLTVQAWSIVNPRTESVCEIVAADVAGSHGARPDVLILNELSHIGKREFAENLLDNAAKVPHGLVCIATNAGFVPSWQWDLREAVRESERWHFSAYTQPAPWLDAAELAERRRATIPSRYARLWEGVWSAGSGDALQPDDVTAAITRKGPMRRAKPQFVFCAGLDLGISRDASAFVVVGRHCGCLRDVEDDRGPEPVPRNLPVAMQAAYDLGWWKEPEEERERRTWRSQAIKPTGRLRVASVQVWKPTGGNRVDLASVERAILAAHEKYGLAEVAFDPHQAEHLAQRLERRGVPMRRVPFSGANLTGMASAVLEAFNERRIDLFPHEQLLADLRGLRVEERSFGCRLVSPRTSAGHGDAATGLALALLSAQDQSATYEDSFIDGDLVFTVGRH